MNRIDTSGVALRCGGRQMNRNDTRRVPRAAEVVA